MCANNKINNIKFANVTYKTVPQGNINLLRECFEIKLEKFRINNLQPEKGDLKKRKYICLNNKTDIYILRPVDYIYSVSVHSQPLALAKIFAKLCFIFDGQNIFKRVCKLCHPIQIFKNKKELHKLDKIPNGRKDKLHQLSIYYNLVKIISTF